MQCMALAWIGSRLVWRSSCRLFSIPLSAPACWSKPAAKPAARAAPKSPSTSTSWSKYASINPMWLRVAVANTAASVWKVMVKTGVP